MRKIYISKLANNTIINYLKEKNYKLIYTNCPQVYPAIQFHPDILMCHMGTELFIGDPQKIGSKYPYNIRYNCACTGKYFIHNLKYTDDQLLAKAKKLGMTLVHVKQGYTKCNVVVVNENAIITSDMGIYKTCKDIMDVLLISPEQILLPGLNTGFIGGASGKVGREILFNGDLRYHKDFFKIVEFIENKGLDVRWFDGYPLTDIGTIISNEIYI